MPVSGLGTHVGFGIESTWNTPVALTGALPIVSETLSRQGAPIESGALSGGNLMRTTTQWRKGVDRFAGTINTELIDEGLEFWWRLALGGYNYATTVHEYTPGTLDQSATVRVGIGGSASGTAWKEYSGVVVDTWSIDAQKDAIAKVAFDTIAGGELRGDTGAIGGSLPATFAPYVMEDLGTLTLGGASFDCVTGLQISGNNRLAADRTGAGASAIKDPRFSTGRREFTGVLSIEFEDFTATPDWYLQFVDGTHADIIATFTNGSKILTINGQCRVEGNTPNVAGEDLVEVDVPVTFIADDGDDTAGMQIDVDNGTATL